MTTATKRTVKITWVDRLAGYSSAAAIGLDETIETDWTTMECYEAAIYRAQCQGIDIDRYGPMIEDSEVIAGAAALRAEYDALIASGMTYSEAMDAIHAAHPAELED
jgi:hypothetical protein